MKTKKAELYNSSLIDEILNSIDSAEANRIEKRMLLAAKIEDAMKAKGLNKSQFAELMGQNNSVITKWLSGTHNFTTDTLSDIESKLSVKLINIDIAENCQSEIFKAEITISVDTTNMDKTQPPTHANPLSHYYNTQINEHINNNNLSNYC
ncbi:MAG: helix-turn-helix transcriptional regulator [Bacteroidales bacterium]|nr:helix-turn-helix transcriptional regulator [Bacteroidales bacterium]